MSVSTLVIGSNYIFKGRVVIFMSPFKKEYFRYRLFIIILDRYKSADLLKI